MSSYGFSGNCHGKKTNFFHFHEPRRMEPLLNEIESGDSIRLESSKHPCYGSNRKFRCRQSQITSNNFSYVLESDIMKEACCCLVLDQVQ